MRWRLGEEEQAAMISKFALILLIFNNTNVYLSNLYQTCMYDTNDYAYSPIVCLFNPERHELARGIYIL